jgi:monofunctional biosynthetic peptidoglycan transglycosylase
MPSRPASIARKAPDRTRRAPIRRIMGLGRRIRRLLLWSLLIVLLLPAGLLVIYRFVPVPITPLMLIRLAEGEGLRKDWVPLEQIAPALRQAVVAAEDNLFCEHAGFDWAALGEVIDGLRAGEHTRGASTITMQTAKNLFLWPGRSLLRKGLEAWLTPQIELIWPKRRIIEVYLNIVEMGPGIYGAEAASRVWFGKSAADLGRIEATLLAAVLPNPRQWSPARPTDYLLRRASTIRLRIDQLGPMLACTA